MSSRINLTPILLSVFANKDEIINCVWIKYIMRGKLRIVCDHYHIRVVPRHDVVQSCDILILTLTRFTGDSFASDLTQYRLFSIVSNFLLISVDYTSKVLSFSSATEILDSDKGISF